MFLVDNRFQNLGRSNLGWSAKHMGDSICFHVSVLRRYGWGRGLTEDYNLRQQLLLGGIRITYEPEALGQGEATQTWRQARVQRARWLRGSRMRGPCRHACCCRRPGRSRALESLRSHRPSAEADRC